MRTGNKIVTCWIGLFLVACSENVTITQGNRLHLDKAIDAEKTAVLSDLSDSLQCIPLETNDVSLLANRAYLLFADKENLFVNSARQVYRFDKDGHFLNKIGAIGNGPEEYTVLYSASVDPVHRRLLFYVGQKRFLVWSYDGVFQKEIVLQDDGETSLACLLGTDRILSENRRYTDKGLTVSIRLFDMDGKLLSEKALYRDKQLVNVTMKTVPLMYPYKKGVKYKNWNDDNFYSFTSQKTDLEWVFDLGRYNPSRDLLEDMDKRQTLLEEYAQVVDIKESERCFFLLVLCQGKLKGIVIDKVSGVLLCSQPIDMPQNGGGLENDYLPGSNFWPSFIGDNGIMYGMLSVESLLSLDESVLNRYIRYPLLEEDSNPVVLKVYGN